MTVLVLESLRAIDDAKTIGGAPDSIMSPRPMIGGGPATGQAVPACWVAPGTDPSTV